MHVHPELSDDLFLNCHQLKDINLYGNGFSLDQILYIEDQLLSPLNTISNFKLTDESLGCELFANVTYPNCSTVGKINNLFSIAENSIIQCYYDITFTYNSFKNLKDYDDFTRSFEKCQYEKIVSYKNSIITSIVIAAGNSN